MSDPELPDDIDGWPREAHQLLGVDRNTDERDLKRAYTRLIRRFKPDHHPLQFARIRAAYEELLQQLEWRAKWNAAPAEDLISLNQPPEPAPQPEHNAESVVRPAVSNPGETAGVEDAEEASPQFVFHTGSPRECPIDEVLDAAWKSACEGDVAGAYRQLTALHEQDRGHPDVCLRLYWLLRLSPELDTQKQCSDWLVETLRRNHLQGQAWYVYCAEMKRHPELIDSVGNATLRNTEAGSRQLFEFLSLRWRAAADLERWYLIETDLRDFREAVLNDSTSTWANLLFLASDLTVWSQQLAARKLMEQCGRELEQLNELQLELSHAFSRHDLVRELADTLQRRHEKAIPPTVVAVLREAWLDAPYERRPGMQALLESWIKHPASTLSVLDHLAARHRTLFYQLRLAILELDVNVGVPGENESPDEIQRQVMKFLGSVSDLGYASFRLELLKFCLQQEIGLQDVLAVVESNTLPVDLTGRRKLLIEDLPLMVVLRGIAAFWS